MNPRIFVSFRFHGNFYHSYRADTPDELGFGKDIRIIRHIIEVLDSYNNRGIPVCGTWDFENYFSLEQIMPAHCPDIISSLQRRVREGHDEMQVMSYNNGLINAHTAREFEESIRRAITNPAGSGLRDMFEEGYFNMVRPQEMMYTPSHLKLYRALKIDSISLYYSAVPFNGFSNFVSPLSLVERYNPLTLSYPGIEETLTLMPCYNIGDLADHLTLRRWIKDMRKKQLALRQPCDLLLVLDQDADDEIWTGLDVPGWLKRWLSTVRGLEGLIDDVLDLEYVEFTTPGRYLNNHPPIKAVSIGQDTADGSFDGLSSWTEKWSNHQIFTGLERARILALQTRRLCKDASLSQDIGNLLTESFEYRLKLLSTTHFGMATPVMNATREKIAVNLAEQAVTCAAQAFQLACASSPENTFSLIDYVRGEATDLVQFQGHPSRALIRLPLRENTPAQVNLQTQSGETLASTILNSPNRRDLLFLDSFEPLEQKQYYLQPVQDPAPSKPAITRRTNSLQNEFIRLEFDEHGGVNRMQAYGQEFSSGSLLESAIEYGNRLYRVGTWETVESLEFGLFGIKRLRGEIRLPGGYAVQYEREILISSELPYIYIKTQAVYLSTPHRGFNPNTARRLQQTWDNRWQAVHPCEIRPQFTGNLRVWKHDYCGHVSSYSLDYSGFSKNVTLTSANNQITNSWVAVSNGRMGVLLAQTADISSSVAFCPVRTTHQGVRLNPFGTYWGPQYKYGTADTHLGAFLAATISAASHIRSSAPSYNGHVQEFSLLLAPYLGDCPPEQVQYDAEAFAYPYAVVDGSGLLLPPEHQNWHTDNIM